MRRKIPDLPRLCLGFLSWFPLVLFLLWLEERLHPLHLVGGFDPDYKIGASVILRERYFRIVAIEMGPGTDLTLRERGPIWRREVWWEAQRIAWTLFEDTWAPAEKER